MPLVTPNPNAEADSGFECAQPGVYNLRIEGSANFPDLQEFTSKAGNKCLKVRLVFADHTSITTDKGTPAKNLNSIIEQSLVLEPAEKQGKLRAFVESAGLVWDTFTDTDMLHGLEVKAKVGIEEYNGEKRNVVQRYVKPGA